MGLCLSSEERAERARSQRIDRMIEDDHRKLKRECKLLLLGKILSLFPGKRVIPLDDTCNWQAAENRANPPLSNK